MNLGIKLKLPTMASKALLLSSSFGRKWCCVIWGLPGIDGYEVARRLRQCSELSEIHLISTSGYGQKEDKQRALAAGFDAHLVEPIDFRELQRLLSELAG